MRRDSLISPEPQSPSHQPSIQELEMVPDNEGQLNFPAFRRVPHFRRDSLGIRSSMDSESNIVNNRSNQMEPGFSRFANLERQSTDAQNMRNRSDPREQEDQPSVDISRRSFIQLNRLPRRNAPEGDGDINNSDFPGISIIEPSNPDVLLTVQQFMNLRIDRLSKMVEHIDELGLYFLIHTLFVFVLGFRLALHNDSPFQYSLCLFVPFYCYKFALSVRKVQSSDDRKERTYYSLSAINNGLLVFTIIMLIIKTSQGLDFSILAYCAPMIIAAIIRAFKSSGDGSPCFSLLQLFKTMGVVLRAALIITISVKYQEYIGWSWSSALWPFWCSLAIQGVMIIFTLILLLWSIVMYCRKSYPLSFRKQLLSVVLGALWAFYVTYGFSFTFTWFIINSVRALDKMGSSATVDETSQEIAKNLIYVFVYLLIATIFTFTTRKSLPYWFERMLYSPAELEHQDNFSENQNQQEPQIKEKRYFTPKFITRITNAYFRKSKESEKRKAQENIRKRNREDVHPHPKTKHRFHDDHQTSISAGILMSTSNDYVMRTAERFKETSPKETEQWRNFNIKPIPIPLSVKNSTMQLKMSQSNIDDSESNIRRKQPQSTTNYELKRNPVRFNFAISTPTQNKRSSGLKSLFNFFKGPKHGNLKKEQKRVGVQDPKDIDNLKSQECCVCLSNSPNCVIMECGHGSLCFSCGERLIRSNQTCPLCRDEIKAVLLIDLANMTGKTIRVIRCLFKEQSREERKKEIQTDGDESFQYLRNERRSSLPTIREQANRLQDRKASNLSLEDLEEEYVESSKIESQAPSDDPFELFSFRQQHESKDDQQSQEEEKTIAIGEQITPQRKNILVELEQDLQSAANDQRPTTVVGLKRIKFEQEEEVE